MKTLKVMIALGLGALVSACGAMPDVASRNAPFEATPAQTASLQPRGTAVPFAQTAPGSLRVAQVNVNVPRTLKVSEKNVYYPKGDIVWRGDPIGDRYLQIEEIFKSAAYNGTKDMIGERAVNVDLQLVRFHSVSERTRASVGGVHNMHFFMTVTDAATGALVRAPREVVADLPAYGGSAAIKAENNGQTQKVRVTGYLAQVIRQELQNPNAQSSAKITTVKQTPRSNSNI